MRKKKAFTLLELMVTVIIVSILASVGFVSYLKTVERTHQREAEGMLQLIAAAEKMYELDNNVYTSCDNTADCNAVLDLDISGKYWNYRVHVNGSQFCAQAVHSKGGRSVSFHIDESLSEPVSGGCSY